MNAAPRLPMSVLYWATVMPALLLRETSVAAMIFEAFAPASCVVSAAAVSMMRYERPAMLDRPRSPVAPTTCVMEAGADSEIDVAPRREPRSFVFVPLMEFSAP